MGKEKREKLAEIFDVYKVDLACLVLLCQKMALYEKYDENYVMNQDFVDYRNAIADLCMELCGYTFDATSRRYVELIR